MRVICFPENATNWIMHMKNRYDTTGNKKKNAPKYKAHKNLIIKKVYLTTNLFFIEFPK